MNTINETRPPAVRLRRHPRDTTEAERAVLEPLLPVPACELPMSGPPEKHPRRKVEGGTRRLRDPLAHGLRVFHPRIRRRTLINGRKRHLAVDMRGRR
ncbi:hypothetical protein [Streptomyces griseoruber]|uniref:Transposase n=1 Tax=Streptomyces griseoruber TaxID=1943 RepID=A0A101T1J5_9ACTN|nr:hypothetical protein [Streptomyces griseoruber]KUN84020.1 hypothetical protein AQJ64_16300 [Streptomyces griseoruber]